MSFIRTVVGVVLLLFVQAGYADPTQEEAAFKNQEALFDVSDALRSKQYVHRAILTTLVRDTSGLSTGRFYINHLMGFSNVFQTGKQYTKYSTGLQGASFGYVTMEGHGFELGLEVSNVSNVQMGYRYFVRPADFSLWGFVGLGFGMELASLSIADGPPQASLYSGAKQMGFTTFGLMVPVIDVAFKAEARFSFYGMDRIIMTTGLGVVLFL